MTVTLTIKRRIEAPPALVFRALTEAAFLARWMFPEGCSHSEVESDPRPGGLFRIVMRERDGRTHPAEARYLEVRPHQRIALAWRWTGEGESGVETTLRFELRDETGGTHLTLVHEGLADEEALESHRRGWTGALNHLEPLAREEAKAWTD